MIHINLYLNTYLRQKEIDVHLFDSEDIFNADLLFSIYTKHTYLEYLIEKYDTKLNQQNFFEFVEYYNLMYQDIEDKFNKEEIIIEESSFFINKPFIEIEDVIICCQNFNKNKSDFKILISDNEEMYPTNTIKQIIEEKETTLMNNHIELKIKNLLNTKRRIILLLLEIWINQYIKENKLYPTNLKNLLIPSEEGVNYVVNHKLIEEVKNKAMENLGLVNFLMNLYGENEGKYLLKVFRKNPHLYWKY